MWLGARYNPALPELRVGSEGLLQKNREAAPVDQRVMKRHTRAKEASSHWEEGQPKHGSSVQIESAETILPQ